MNVSNFWTNPDSTRIKQLFYNSSSRADAPNSLLMPQILIIDDDPLIQRVLKKALEAQHYQVAIASDGQEGLALARELQPALIVCDWMMPRMDGLEVCRQIKADPQLTITFFILLTSRDAIEDRIMGLDTGADDFLSKPIEINELQARVRAGLRLHYLSRDLQSQKHQLEHELTEAALYVRSLLPATMNGTVSIDSRFIPSSKLGGDCYDYYWLDPDYLVMYLLDVSGHGLGAALPSITVLNLLRSQSLPNVNFYQPQNVLRALNETFQMDSQNDKYFTIWYGVYNRVKRQLVYASAGHPPAVLVIPENGTQKTVPLRTPGMPIGMIPDAAFTSDRCEIPPNSTLYVFSDGVYDLPNQSTDQVWGLYPFIELLAQTPRTQTLDSVLDSIHAQSHAETVGDDLSILKITFDRL